MVLDSLAASGSDGNRGGARHEPGADAWTVSRVFQYRGAGIWQWQIDTSHEGSVVSPWAPLMAADVRPTDNDDHRTAFTGSIPAGFVHTDDRDACGRSCAHVGGLW